MIETIVFAVFAVLALASATVVVVHRDPVKSTMSMVVTLVSLAALFALLGAPFIAALQILLYTGAILVLFLFVIMLLNVGRLSTRDRGHAVQRWTAIGGAAFFAGLLAMLLWRANRGAPTDELTEEYVSIVAVAETLFSEFLLPFWIVGLVLLVAVVAASMLARKPEGELQPIAESGDLADRDRSLEAEGR